LDESDNSGDESSKKSFRILKAAIPSIIENSETSSNK